MISASAKPSPKSGSLNVLMRQPLSRNGEFYRTDDSLHARDVIVLELEQRHDGVEAGDALDRSLQIVEAVLRDQRRDLGAHADVAGGLVHDHEPAGFGDRRENRLDVDRTQGRKVDDLGADPALVELRAGA